MSRTARRTNRPLLCALLAGAVAGLACEGEDRALRQPPRLVLLYATCTVSTTYLAPYDETIEFTPNLARFASRAVTFTSHRTEAGSSGIAYASLFTGTGAHRHGVFQHPSVLGDESYLLAEAFAEQGYETFFWGGHGMASAELNYGQGVTAGNTFDAGLRAEDPRFVELLERLRADPTRRAFVFTNFTLTHGPYRADTVTDFLRELPGQALELEELERQRLTGLYAENHLALAYNFEGTVRRLGLEPESVRDLVAAIELAYKANVWRLDRAFGAVIDAVDASGLGDDSLVTFTADHGEVLFREGELFKYTHSSSLAPEVLEVPLLVRAPRLEAGRYPAVTRSIDVFPTLLGLAGLPQPGDRAIDGRDLTGSLLGLAPAPDLPAYSHTSVIPDAIYERMQQPGAEETWRHRMERYPRPDIRFSEVALRHRNLVFKLRNLDSVHFEVEAFDRSSDPLETANLFDPGDPRHRKAAEALRLYKARLVESASREPSDLPLSREKAEAELRALGYIR